MPAAEALDSIIAVLNGYLHPDFDAYHPTVTLTSVSEQSVGLGNRRGSDTRSTFSVVELKGIRLNALAKFELSGTDQAAANTAISNLNKKLIGDRDKLWAGGVLRLALETTSEAIEVSTTPSNPRWRKQADYRILFEHRYEDNDDAGGLIAQICIVSKQEVDGSLATERMTVTDEMTRWDRCKAPPLTVRGRLVIENLSALAYVDEGPSGIITLTRTFEGASGMPVTYLTLGEFFAAVRGTSPVDRHAQVILASLEEFLAALPSQDAEIPQGAEIMLSNGEKGENDQQVAYKPKVLKIVPPVYLPTPADSFEVKFQDTALDKKAVVYLRFAHRSRT